MELVTERDMKDAKALGERAEITSMDDWDDFVHDIAQAIADGRRKPEQAVAKPDDFWPFINSIGR